MKLSTHLKTYKTNQVATANQGRLVLMMYEGALNFAREARKKALQNDIGGRGVYLSKAQNIVNELHGSLDRNKGGEIARNLERLYLYIEYAFTQANATGNPKFIDDAIQVLETLEEAWKTVVAGNGRDQAVPKNGTAPVPRLAIQG
jgi:flagellar protein FliS